VVLQQKTKLSEIWSWSFCQYLFGNIYWWISLFLPMRTRCQWLFLNHFLLRWRQLCARHSWQDCFLLVWYQHGKIYSYYFIVFFIFTDFIGNPFLNFLGYPFDTSITQQQDFCSSVFLFVLIYFLCMRAWFPRDQFPKAAYILEFPDRQSER